MRRSGRRERERGVALLLVLVVLLLVAALTTEIATTARTHHQLAEHSMNEFLLRSAVDARVHILRAALEYDRTRGDNVDTEDDPWAYRNHEERLSNWGDAASAAMDRGRDDEEEDGPARFRNRDMEIVAWCEDERSKLNLRGLARPEESAPFRHTREALVRLLDVYRDEWRDLDLSEGDAEEMVDDLVEWLREAEDTEDNPMPNVKPNRGRLLSVDDLLRVPGGRFSPAILYDVRDPEWEEGQYTRPAEDLDSDDASDGWTRRNGVPGLMRYVTLWAEDVPDPQLKINVNTAPLPVLLALLDPQDEDLAQAILDHRREGAGDLGEETDPEAETGWFKSKADLSEVDGVSEDLARHPRLDFFADVQSPVFSLWVIARATTVEGREAEEEGEVGQSEVRASYQYREVVQRTSQGFVTLYMERRQDPLFE